MPENVVRNQRPVDARVFVGFEVLERIFGDALVHGRLCN